MIQSKASKPKRGAKFTVDGKEVYLYHIKNDMEYVVCEDIGFGIDANYRIIDPESLKPATKPRKEINRVSSKQDKINRAYAVICSQFKKDHPICQARIKCSGALTEDVHHPDGRVGKLMLDSTKFKAVCRACHIWIEENPKQAKALGLSGSRLSTQMTEETFNNFDQHISIERKK